MNDWGILIDAVIGFVIIAVLIKLDALKLKMEERIGDNRFKQSLINESLKDQLMDVAEEIRLMKQEDES